MYKVIKQNPQYEIDLNNDIRRVDGKPLDLNIENEKVYIRLVGFNTRWIDLNWLALITHYNVDLPKHIANRLFDIRFTKVENSNLKLKPREWLNGYIMEFTRPIYLKPGFRVIPNVTDLAISEDGNTVLRCVDYSEVNIGSSEYKTLTIKGVSYVVHRLVAYAWIPNYEQSTKTIINHINANKHDNRKSNLEWCTYQHNSKHASDNGLVKNAVPAKVRDFITGEVTQYSALSEVNKLVGTQYNTPAQTYLERMPSNLYKGRYEVRVEGDERPWYYEGKDKIEKNGKYTVTITDEDGNVNVIRDVRDLIKEYKLWNLSNNVKLLTRVLKERQPELDIKVEGTDLIEPIEVLEIATGVVTEYPSIRKVSRELGLTFGMVRTYVKRDKRYAYKGYVFRYKSDEPFTWEEEVLNPIKTIKATNKFNGKVKILNSKREAAKHFNVDRTTISRAIQTGDYIGGYKLTFN